MSAPDWELPEVSLPFEVGDMDPTSVHDDGTGAGPHDAGILLYPQAGTDGEPRWVSEEEIRQSLQELKAHVVGIISAGLNFTPGIGKLKNVIEAFVGHDLLTGHHLAWWERA